MFYNDTQHDTQHDTHHDTHHDTTLVFSHIQVTQQTLQISDEVLCVHSWTSMPWGQQGHSSTQSGVGKNKT